MNIFVHAHKHKCADILINVELEHFIYEDQASRENREKYKFILIDFERTL